MTVPGTIRSDFSNFVTCLAMGEKSKVRQLWALQKFRCENEKS